MNLRLSLALYLPSREGSRVRHPRFIRGLDTVKRILVNEQSCSGCRACEVACVAEHEGRFGTAAARIRVAKIDALGVDRPHVCRLCRRPPCVAACPTQALTRDDDLGAVILDPDECIGCSACVDDCPFGMISLHRETGLPLVCNLCGGDPACVKRCATGAIVDGDPRAAASALRQMLNDQEGGE